ncbi:MAG: prolyl oligopeptidase family serine peptidase [Flavobacteriaceae bacterium]|nr:prolyl oligopeptidase family serine peptidase [Flavobacteriaceae bacterium]
MKKLLLLIILFNSFNFFAQNGKIVDRTKYNWKNDTDTTQIVWIDGKLKQKYSYLNHVIIEKITYLSDGLKVKGYLVQPNKSDSYPCIIYNRGGNKEFAKLTSKKAIFILARVASWGYVVAASQYRGNDGGEGKEEFGGKDVNDVLHLVPLFDQIKNSDTSKMGIYGWSRGGMMTYLTLTKTNKFKAAVVGGAVSDLRMVMETRKDTFETVYFENIPNYAKNKVDALNSRSAINQVENISKTTPILMLHGTADWRVVPEMALDLSKAFIKNKIPHRLVMLEGGNHGLTEFNEEVDQMVKQWFDKYLKNNKTLPNLNPHGR